MEKTPSKRMRLQIQREYDNLWKEGGLAGTVLCSKSVDHYHVLPCQELARVREIPSKPRRYYRLAQPGRSRCMETRKERKTRRPARLLGPRHRDFTVTQADLSSSTPPDRRIPQVHIQTDEFRSPLPGSHDFIPPKSKSGCSQTHREPAGRPCVLHRR